MANNNFPDIPGNSLSGLTTKQNSEEKTSYDAPEKVIKGYRKPKGKILKKFIPDDDIPDIETYLRIKLNDIFDTVILPNAKTLLVKSFAMLIGGDARNADIQSGGGIPKVSYDKAWQGGTPVKSLPQKKSFVLYQDVYFKSKDELDEFRNVIEGIYNDQGFITVLQFMNHAGFETYPEQSNYGWTSLSGMVFKYTIDGWMAKMPYPSPLY